MRLYPALPRPPRADAGRARARSGRRRRRCSRASAGRCDASDELEADDVMFSFAPREAEARRRGAAADRPTATCTRPSSEHVAVVELAQGRDASRIGPGAGARALRGRARAGGGLHRAARRPLRRPAGRAGDRREDRRRAAARATARSRRVLAAARRDSANEPRRERGGQRGRCARAPRPRCCENAELLRTFKQIATLQRIDVDRPRRPRDRLRRRRARWRASWA